jgi:ribonuclease P protein component
VLVAHAQTTDSRAGLPPRVGLVVSKAVGGAVVRNRTKRRLRALLAARLGLLPAGTDVVIRANPVAAQANWEDLSREVDSVLTRVLRKLGGPRPGGTA